MLQYDGVASDMRFRLNSEECELLLAFRQHGSLARLAEERRRDISVVSRQFKRLSEKAQVLVKDGGKWKLTPFGERICAWAHDSILHQSHLFNGEQPLRIATTSEFASRVLVPVLGEFVAEAKVIPTILTTDRGTESKLLSGEADLAFDCGIPESPEIAFKRIKEEPLCVVASPNFLKKHKVFSFDGLLSAPYLNYRRISLARALELSGDVTSVFGYFDTVSATRAACLAGLGWSILPAYAVKDELKQGRLRKMDTPVNAGERFGVWWRRGDVSIAPWVNLSTQWLKKQDLS